MRLAARISFLLAIVMVGLYLWAGRSHWYSEWEREVELGSNPLYSDTIDIGERGEVSWTVPKHNWIIDEGEAHVSIVFDRIAGIPRERYRRDGMTLRGRFDAYAVDGNGMRTSRRIRNWYFTTDEPLSPDARLWTSGTEFGLGGVWVYPFEELVVTFDVLEPDAELTQANPRLKIVPKHDYAVFGHLAIVRLFRDGGLIICAILLLSMAVMYWKLSRFAERAS